MTKEIFEPAICEKIGYYVYRLQDGDETFYIGKGKGNRVFQHEIQAKNESLESHNLKLQKIMGAKEKNTFKVVIHRHGLSEDQAFLLESSLIDMHQSYGKSLTNVQQGFQQGRYGECSPEQLGLIYSTPSASIYKPTTERPVNSLLISINSSWKNDEKTPEGILRMVQYSWRIRRPCVEQIPYVFAVANKVIRGVYTVDEWLESTDEKWTSLLGLEKLALSNGRYGFTGSVAPINVWSRFVNTKLPDELNFGSGQPILYGHTVI